MEVAAADYSALTVAGAPPAPPFGELDEALGSSFGD